MMLKDIDFFLDNHSKIYFLLSRINNCKLRFCSSKGLDFKNLYYYEKKWKNLNLKYDEINVYGIEFMSIGETMPRLFTYLKNKKERNKTAYHIVLPIFSENYRGKICNESIFDILGKYIHFITEENINFWLYVFLRHSAHINIDKFNFYAYREPKTIYIKEGKSLIPFTAEMEKYGQKKLQQMGITGDYICLHARGKETKSNDFILYPSTTSACVNINTFGRACGYISKLGYQAVRMGRDESTENKMEGVIDYANCYYDAFMDFYLLAKCKFIIGSPSGLSTMAAFGGRPVLITNLNAFCYGFESCPVTRYCLYLPKNFIQKIKEDI